MNILVDVSNYFPIPFVPTSDTGSESPERGIFSFLCFVGAILSNIYNVCLYVFCANSGIIYITLVSL